MFPMLGELMHHVERNCFLRLVDLEPINRRVRAGRDMAATCAM